MIDFFRNLFNREPAFGAARSNKWRKVRKEYLRKHPRCELTGSTKKLEVHHILPVHMFPELELEPSNLITLSGKKIWGVKPHQFFGHLGNFKSYNPTVKLDAKVWLDKIINRDNH